jgi:hypothetical protein
LSASDGPWAFALVTSVNVFGPDAAISGGGIALARGERPLAPTAEAVAGQAFHRHGGRVRIVPDALGEDVGRIGMVRLVASALPGLMATADHGRATAGPAAATTYRPAPGVAMRPGPARHIGDEAVGAPAVTAATEQGVQG